MARGLTREQIGVTPAMLQTFGEVVFDLSHNHQARHGDPIRLQLVDVLRRHAGKVCVCELVPLFDLSQPTVSHHLKVLRDAGIVDSERRGL